MPETLAQRLATDEVENRMREMPTLWYETPEGKRWSPNPHRRLDKMLDKPPAGYVYQCSRFPTCVTESVLGVKGGNGRPVAHGTASYRGDMVLAATRPTAAEEARAMRRYGRPGPRMTFEQAVLAAAFSCEACTNALAHRLGLPWGYRRGSAAWRQARTSCECCRPTVGRKTTARRAS